MRRTSVVSVRGKKRPEMESDPEFVYVGRAVRWTTWDHRSPWCNPFSQASSGGRSPLDLYAEHIHARLNRDPGLMARLIAELRGKTLGCWCGEWVPGEPEIGCHAVMLAKLAEGIKS